MILFDRRAFLHLDLNRVKDIGEGITVCVWAGGADLKKKTDWRHRVEQKPEDLWPGKVRALGKRIGRHGTVTTLKSVVQLVRISSLPPAGQAVLISAT